MSFKTRPMTRMVRIFDLIDTTKAELPPRLKFLKAVVCSIHQELVGTLQFEDDRDRMAHRKKIDDAGRLMADNYGRPRKDGPPKMSEEEIQMMMEMGVER